jgi:hypothetical protein
MLYTSLWLSTREGVGESKVEQETSVPLNLFEIARSSRLGPRPKMA